MSAYEKFGSKFGGTSGPFQTLWVKGYDQPVTLPNGLSAGPFKGAACIIRDGSVIDSIDLNAPTFNDDSKDAAEAFYNLLVKHGAQVQPQ